MTKIIGIAGPIGAGKTTLSAELYGQLAGRDIGTEVWETTCAWPLYKIAEALGFRCQLTDQDDKDRSQTLRFDCFEEALQQAIEEVLGGLPDNSKAELYAFFMDEFKEVQDNSPHGPVYVTCSLRYFLRTLGNAGRKVDSYLWIKHILAEAARYVPDGYCIVGDVRFPTEAEHCDDLIWINGGQVGRADDVSESYHKHLEGAATIIMDNRDKDREQMAEAAKFIAGLIHG